jgi:hypothetical protein
MEKCVTRFLPMATDNTEPIAWGIIGVRMAKIWNWTLKHRGLMTKKRIEIPEVDGMTIGEAWASYVGEKIPVHCSYKGQNFIMHYKHYEARKTTFINTGKTEVLPAQTYIIVKSEAPEKAHREGMPFELDEPMADAVYFM